MAPQAEMAQVGKKIQRETILLVDDDSYIRAFMRMLLERAGYTVLTAPDGEQGLRIFESQAPAVDFLLTDLKMPNMSGVQLADTILQLESNLPVLIMTGDGGLEGQQYEFIEKPVTPSLLLRRIAELLRTENRWKDTTEAAPIAK